MLNFRPNVFLGPVCPYVLSPVSRFASIWSIPVFTTGGLNAAFRFKNAEYRLLTCMAGTYQQFGSFFKQLLLEYSWNHVSFLYQVHPTETGRGMSMCEFILGQTFNMLGGLKNENISHIPFNVETSNHSTYEDLLVRSAKKSHVIALCAPSPVVRKILLTAEKMGMMKNGDFVFFNVDLFINDLNLYKPWENLNDSPEENKRAKEAYEAVLTISSFNKKDTKLRQFHSKVQSVSSTVLNNTEPLHFNQFVADYYDALSLYANAIEKVLEKRESIANISGEEITKEISVNYKLSKEFAREK